MATHHGRRVPDALSNVFAAYAERLADVLHDGEIDDYSRQRLAGIYRTLCWSSAQFTGLEPARAAGDDGLPDSLADSTEERAWVDSWHDHVGSLSMLTSLKSLVPYATYQRWYDARLGWADEVERLTDAELLRRRGIGPKSVAALRAALDFYYWRGDPAVSHSLWTEIADRMQRAIEYRYQRQLERARDGLLFARDVLEQEGAPLRDPLAARNAAR